MEYRVYLLKLRQSAERLEQIARKQRRTYDSLQETIRKLKRLSYMEPVITVLYRKIRELEEELQKILRMAQSLRRIEQRYRDMENAILDGLELPAGGQRQNGAGPFRPGTPAWPPRIVLPPQPPRPRPRPEPWLDGARDVWEKLINDPSIPRRPRSPQSPWIDPAITRRIWEAFNNINGGTTDTNPTPPFDPTPSDIWRIFRDFYNSPLWVALNGRNTSRWCCPVVNLLVSPMTPQEVPDGLLIRLSEAPAADN